MITTDQLKRDHSIEIAAIILVCRVFAGTATEEELKTYLLQNKIDWALFYKTALIHQVRPIVFKVIHSLDIPDDIKATLQADCKYITFQNLGNAKELARLYALLQQANIHVVPWKGSTFCLQYYKDIGLREFCDIDFLINLDIKELDTVKSIFEGLGYVDKSNIPEAFKETHFNHTREYYFDFYENDKRKFHVEFHWFTASQIFDFARPMPNTVLLKNLNETDIYGKKIKTPDATHHFIAIVAHHGLNQRWNLLKYVMDTAQLLQHGEAIDGKEIAHITKTYGFQKALHLGLYIADELLGVKSGIPYQKPQDADNYLADLLSSSNKKKKNILHTLYLNLKIKDSLTDKLRMAGKYIGFAATPSILDYKFMKLPRALFFLYPIVKPIRILSGSMKKSNS